jgi:hypothetical protein
MRKRILSLIVILISSSALAQTVSRAEAAKQIREFFGVIGNETRNLQGQVTHPLYTTRYFENFAGRSKGENVTVNAHLTIGPVTSNWTSSTFDVQQSLLIEASSESIAVIQLCEDHEICRNVVDLRFS